MRAGISGLHRAESDAALSGRPVAAGRQPIVPAGRCDQTHPVRRAQIGGSARQFSVADDLRVVPVAGPAQYGIGNHSHERDRPVLGGVFRQLHRAGQGAVGLLSFAAGHGRNGVA